VNATVDHFVFTKNIVRAVPNVVAEVGVFMNAFVQHASNVKADVYAYTKNVGRHASNVRGEARARIDASNTIATTVMAVRSASTRKLVRNAVIV
jgi:hypothetical protein